ncbi:MAG: DNA photolyase family protein [Acidimicrobiia bacterium]|nr:DNA photolyase family protein [Acidimicrobiia bacterium]
MSAGLVWFRADLRLGDNPAWAAATAAHETVVALFVIDPVLWDGSGEHRRNQLAAHLGALDASLRARGGRLRVRRGDPARVVPAEAAAVRAERVYWNGDATPYAARRDAAVRDALGDRAEEHPGRFVHAPGTVLTGDGGPFKVFTPFYRAWQARPWDPWPEPGAAGVAADPGDGVPPTGPSLMAPGEEAAVERLESFLERVDRYPEERDRPDLDTTSRLSADLKFGTISPRAVVRRVEGPGAGRAAFVRQIAWREFYAQLLAAFPETRRRAMRPEYDRVAWRHDPDGLAAWAEGRTGYPIVDAAMRQLRAEGWVHNRTRMVAASFLVKDLLIDWRLGERHFLDWLVDGDVAQNVGNWQWVAGTGADAAPYFRVFNPVAQGIRFDPEGEYVRRWVPELAGLPVPAIHAPWEAPPEVLAAAGVTLGVTYPPPLVDHAEAREAVLAAFAAAKNAPQ